MTSLIEANLPAVCSLVTDGTHDSPKIQTAGVPFIKGKDISSGEIDFNDCDFITEEDHELCKKRVLPQKDDILLANIGSIGDVARVKGETEFSIKNVALLRPDPAKINPLYLYYLVQSPLFQGKLQNLRLGAAQSYISLVNLRRFKFQIIDSIDTQTRIADVLSAYDDLIENNRRRIGLLEQSARLLYKEWFVHLRFPGYEHVKIIEGVPEEWENKSFSNVLESQIGGGWGQEEPQGSETTPAYVIRGTDIESVIIGDFEGIGLRYHKDSALQSRLLKEGDIIFEVSGGSATQLIGRSLLISKKMIDVYDGSVICASFCKRFTPLSLPLSPYLYYHIKHIRENGELNTYIKQSASALQNFNYAAFLQHYFVRIPNRLLLDQFAEQVSLFESQMFTLAMQIHNLKRARDLLLPRIMNGEIVV